MYFLALVSLLNLFTMQPNLISAHERFDDCAMWAAKMNTDDRLQTDEARSLALRFVCLKLVPET